MKLKENLKILFDNQFKEMQTITQIKCQNPTVEPEYINCKQVTDCLYPTLNNNYTQTTQQITKKTLKFNEIHVDQQLFDTSARSLVSQKQTISSFNQLTGQENPRSIIKTKQKPINQSDSDFLKTRDLKFTQQFLKKTHQNVSSANTLKNQKQKTTAKIFESRIMTLKTPVGQLTKPDAQESKEPTAIPQLQPKVSENAVLQQQDENIEDLAQTIVQLQAQPLALQMLQESEKCGVDKLRQSISASAQQLSRFIQQSVVQPDIAELRRLPVRRIMEFFRTILPLLPELNKQQAEYYERLEFAAVQTEIPDFLSEKQLGEVGYFLGVTLFRPRYLAFLDAMFG